MEPLYFLFLDGLSERYDNMFTGLVQVLGEVSHREQAGFGGARFGLSFSPAWRDMRQGESIAVNGVCLTVESCVPGGGGFGCYASAETLDASTLGSLRSGDHVNLERALQLGDRLGGHFVSGHVDGVANIVSVSKEGLSHSVRLRVDPLLCLGVIQRGSVALDGVSLTVVECGRDFLCVNVIPETWAMTTLSGWKPGSRVNIETDMIGKYVSHLLTPWSGREAGRDNGGLTLDFLREHGF